MREFTLALAGASGEGGGAAPPAQCQALERARGGGGGERAAPHAMHGFFPFPFPLLLLSLLHAFSGERQKQSGSTEFANSFVRPHLPHGLDIKLIRHGMSVRLAKPCGRRGNEERSATATWRERVGWVGGMLGEERRVERIGRGVGRGGMGG